MLYGHLLNLNGRGGEGIDFDANLAISTLDFGTAHVSLWHFHGWTRLLTYFFIVLPSTFQ